jgi:glycosyltransferase involved in cell wall biosynthesis/2-polyprenyl-3-methyl-5-hydroxy-6-metoxy-1,4-benzoquinol methylase
MKNSAAERHTVLYVSGFSGIVGGGQRSFLLLLKNLDRTRFRPVVLCPSEGDVSRAVTGMGIEALFLEQPELTVLKLPAILAYAVKLRRLVRSTRAEIIHCDTLVSAFLCGISFTGAALVLHARVSESGCLLDRIVPCMCARIICVSRAVTARFTGCGNYSGKIKVIYNGVDTDEFSPGKGREEFRRGIGVRPSAVLIGYAGQMMESKGLAVLLAAFKRTREVFPESRLVLAGRGDLEPVLREKARAYGLEDSVIFTGFLGDTSGFMAGIDVFVLPSFWFEGFSRVIIEAMACGRPVIATDVGGNPEAVAEGETGFLVASGDAGALAGKMLALLRDPGLRARLGAGGRQRALELFGVGATAAAIHDLYEWLVGGAGLYAEPASPEPGGSCNLCGGSAYKVRETAEPPFKVLECLDCGLVRVSPLPAAAALSEHYDKEYYRDWLDAQREKRRRMWKTRLDGIERSRPRGRLLDVGCGDGAFLEQARLRGWQVSGTELSAYAAEYTAKTLGAPVFNGELRAAGYPAASFDVVTMWHVLEHMPDPRGCLEEARRVMAPGGLLVIAVPNVNDLLMRAAYLAARFRRERLFSVKDREVHLYHFSPKTIRKMTEAAGFSCLKVAPDFGITDPVKRGINAAASLPYYLFGAGIYNAIEVYAVKER